MAVLNLTPDSFFAASRAAATPADIVQKAEAAVAAGAQILDLGAESTRPGSSPLAPEAEQQRLMPVLAAVRRALPSVLISADTRHAATAARALDAGADIINDVSGLEDRHMADVLAASSCGVVLMHHRGDFATMQDLPPLADPLACVQDGLASLVVRANAAGIAEDRTVLDPGFGFGKNLGENFPLLAGLGSLHAFNRPLLAGLSRKSFLRSHPSQPPEERLPASLAAATIAVLVGAHMLRVHDVAATAEAVRIADHFLRSQPFV